MSVGEIMGYLPFNSRTSGASVETTGPAFWRSASSKINGAFDRRALRPISGFKYVQVMKEMSEISKMSLAELGRVK